MPMSQVAYTTAAERLAFLRAIDYIAEMFRVAQALKTRGYRCHVVPARGFVHHLGLIYGSRA